MHAEKTAEMFQGPCLDLAYTFLRDPQIRADLAEGLLAGTFDPEAADEDPPFAIVETSEQVRDDSLSTILDELLLDWVARSSTVSLRIAVPGDKPTCSSPVPSSGSELVPDCPGGVGAEIVAPGEVELVDRADQCQVADADQLGADRWGPRRTSGR